jgi:hydrogenase large subunit
MRITVDPITRIEGHLRIDCEVENGKVAKSWSSGQMWRGIEIILQGRDPRDAWIFAQRICGVCTTVHAIVSVRAIENALALEVPLNAQYIRNMIVAAHGIHDHIVHFYQLSALDWVDIVSALKADPKAAAKLAQSLSDWTGNSEQEFRKVQDRVKGFVESGQLGVFGSGYWGHPAMKLPPEVNLLAVVHYMQALDYQRRANQIVGILGSKTPHIQNLAVGGVANPINPESQSTLTLERLYKVKALIDQTGDFVNQVYLPDVAAIGALYAEWTQYGAGVMNYLSVPDMPLDTKGTTFAMPSGYIPNGDIAAFKPISDYRDRYFEDGVKESAKHAWYRDDGALHPYDGKTNPDYVGFQDDGKYSWVKAPTFYDVRAQVGPLANVLAMVASGHEPTKRHLGRLMAIAGKVHSGAAAFDRPFDDRPPRRPRRPLRRSLRDAGSAVEPADGEHRQGRFRDLQPADVPEGRDPRLRLPRGAARRALPLGGHPQRQDRQLSGGGAEHLERRPARRGERDGPVRGLARRQSRRRPGEAVGGAAHRPLLRSVPRLCHPPGRHPRPRDGPGQGRVIVDCLGVVGAASVKLRRRWFLQMVAVGPIHIDALFFLKSVHHAIPIVPPGA